MPDNPEITVKIDGRESGGWKEVRINKGIEQIAGTFDLKVADKWPGQLTRITFRPGDACEVLINGETVITGHIDAVPISYSDDDHTITLTGRDVTGDLVDCGHVDQPANEWKNATIDRIIKAICAPFNIPVKVEAPLGPPVESFKINEGDTCLDAIIELCEMRTVKPVSYGDGALSLTRTGAKTATDILRLGDNVKSGGTPNDNRDRFSDYVVKGQSQGSDKKTSADHLTAEGRATDPIIKRWRPLVIIAGGQGTKQSYKERAQWEATARAGRSRQLSYEVAGWLQQSGRPWPINAEVVVEDAYLDMRQRMLISAVSFSLNENSGSVSHLTLSHPDAFNLLPTPEKIKGAVDSGFVSPTVELFE